MPTYTFISPTGKKYRITGPDGSTEEDAWEIVQSHMGATEINPMNDPKIQRAVSARSLVPPESAQELETSIKTGIPSALRREQMRADYNPLQAAAISAGSEGQRIGEGARMLFGGPETVAKAQADRAERERIMAPLENARTTATMVGKAVPGAAVPGGAAGGILRRILTAAFGSGAYEGVASGGDTAATGMAAAGGAAGGGIGHLLNRYFVGNPKNIRPGGPLSGEHGRRVGQAEQLGFELTPAQRAGNNETLAQFEAGLARSPYSSAPFSELAGGNATRANEIARQSVGLPGDDLITDEVLESAHDKIGAEFKKLVGEDKSFPIQQSFYDDLVDIEAKYGGSVTRGNRFKKIADNMRELGNGQYITVKDYQRQASDLARAARSANTGDAGMDPAFGNALQEARNTLDRQFDDAFGDLPELRDNRAKYRRLKQLEKPGVIRQGNVSLPSLYNVIKRQENGRVRGGGDLDTAAKVGSYMASSVPNSGTPTAMAIQNFQNSGMLGRAQMLGGNPLAAAYLRSGGLTAGTGARGYTPLPVAKATDVLAPLAGRQQGQAEARGEGLLGGRF